MSATSDARLLPSVQTLKAFRLTISNYNIVVALNLRSAHLESNITEFPLAFRLGVQG